MPKECIRGHEGHVSWPRYRSEKEGPDSTKLLDGMARSATSMPFPCGKGKVPRSTVPLDRGVP
jgi:hypothetical protein